MIPRKWDRSYNRCPDAVIVEGPLAGGHLGFSLKQLECVEENRLEDIVLEVIREVKPFEDRYGQKRRSRLGPRTTDRGCFEVQVPTLYSKRA